MNIVFPIRLNKYLAQVSGISRRNADDLISGKRVTIDGKVATLGDRVEEGNEVRVNGKPINTDVSFIYVALHKPRGYVCSRKRQGDSPTIYELLPDKYHSLKTAGRLDRDSSGIILLTNDGDFAQRMTHPSYHKVKRYTVELDKPLEPLHQQMINDFGVDLEDGKSKLTLERESDDRKRWVVTMSEGRNRQIRRTFIALGYTVTTLHRTDFGPYHVHDIKEGSFEITEPK
ncbi:MAG: rRNA pseudouridine synthase [Candidatus Nomurabacteria bacterium]|nr:MAG: rRNA pseudouridine synthase [Candidatus Nomurabacteria bacterium]